MIFKSFKISIIIRIIFLSLSIFAFFYAIFNLNLSTLIFFISIAILLQVFSLINFVNKTNKELVKFFDSIKYSDFSQTYKHIEHDSSFSQLYSKFSEVMEKFRTTRMEKEEHYRYLQTVVQHVGIGLLCFNQNGEVELINNAAKKLLGVSGLSNIKRLKSFDENLVKVLFKSKSGEKEIVKIEFENDTLQLAVFATEFRLKEQNFKLVSIQNIHRELEEKEMEAWQKLIRVLTHEIMNSITPISSLASTTNNIIIEIIENLRAGDKIDNSEIEDVQGALRTITKRSTGLLNFVDSYRNLTLIPRPDFQIFKIKELFSRVKHLVKSDIKKNNIKFDMSVEPEELELTADSGLIEQVLINLVLNSVHATKDKLNPKIDMKAFTDNIGRVLIQVSDNGIGIMEETKEKIFIPFFTTKKGGSGIGLSLSRQIMRMHNGTINVNSKPDTETVFTLRF